MFAGHFGMSVRRHDWYHDSISSNLRSLLNALTVKLPQDQYSNLSDRVWFFSLYGWCCRKNYPSSSLLFLLNHFKTWTLKIWKSHLTNRQQVECYMRYQLLEPEVSLFARPVPHAQR